VEAVHGDIFQGWKYISVAAFPSVPADKLESSPFIITKETMDVGLEKWWEDMKRICGIDDNTAIKVQAYKSYQEFSKRTTGFVRLGHDLRLTRTQAAENEHVLLGGERGRAVTAGVNLQNRWLHQYNATHPAQVKLRDIADEHRPVVCALMVSLEQEALMRPDTRLLIFYTDFGGGKTVLLRCKALSLSEQGRDVVYISLASTDRHSGTVSPHRSVFDMATRRQLHNTNVRFEDAISMMEKYKQQHSQTRTTNAEKAKPSSIDLLEWFIMNNADADYLVDELLLHTEEHLLKSVLSVLSSLVMHCRGHLWMATRTPNLSTNDINTIEHCLDNLRTYHGVCVAGLPVNQRSTGAIKG